MRYNWNAFTITLYGKYPSSVKVSTFTSSPLILSDASYHHTDPGLLQHAISEGIIPNIKHTQLRSLREWALAHALLGVFMCEIHSSYKMAMDGIVQCVDLEDPMMTRTLIIKQMAVKETPAAFTVKVSRCIRG